MLCVSFLGFDKVEDPLYNHLWEMKGKENVLGIIWGNTNSSFTILAEFVSDTN